MILTFRNLLKMIGQTKELSKKFSCSYENCDWAFTCKSKLNRHLLVHTAEKKHQCSLCDKKFARKTNLVAHEKTHNKNIGCWTCSSCDKIFKSTKELSLHVEQQHTFPRKCPRRRCCKVLQSEKEMEEHLLHHSEQYICEHPNCGKRFSKPFLLQQHSFSHTKEKPYKCDIPDCEKSFGTPQKLQRHKSVHENKRQFSCSYKDCDKSFNLQEYLTAHMRTHEQYKHFKCPIENCSKHFVCAGTLKVHLQKHSGLRPHKCKHPGCSKTYLTLSNLRAHEKVHSKNKLVSFDSTETPPSEIVSDIEFNDFINSPLGIPDVNILSNEVMSREELVAATFGEFVCGQYINEATLLSPSHIAPGSSRKDYDVNILNESDKEKLKDLQEEFVRNIYASSVNTDHSFLPSTLYKDIDTPVTPEATSTTSTTQNDSATEIVAGPSKPSGHIENVTLEPSMELSTGHMEIDGACFEARSCMPDHLYSNQVYENSSTVNVEDIR